MFNKNISRFFKNYAKDNRRVILYASTLAVVQSLLLVPSVYYIKRIFDYDIPNKDSRGLIVNSLLIIGMTLLQSLLSLIHRNIFLKVVKTSVKSLQHDILSTLIFADREFYDDTNRSALANRSINDVDLVDKMMDGILSVFIPQVTLFAVGVLIMFLYNPLIGTTTLFLGGLGFLIQRQIRKDILESIRNYIDAKDNLFRYVNFLPFKQILTKMRNAENDELIQAGNHSNKLIEAGTVAAKKGGKIKITDELVVNISATLLIIIGAVQILAGSASYGNIFGLYFLIAFLKRTATAVQSNWTSTQEGIVSLEKIFSLLDGLSKTKSESGKAYKFNGSIQVRRVSFGYQNSRVLEDIDFEIGQGEIVSITGENGAGKSSLLNLILGFYQPLSGSIEADGRPYTSIHLGNLRSQIGYVPQNQILIDGTVESNILYGLHNANAINELSTTDLYQQLMTGFKNGLQTQITEAGKNLSNGQIQRISILRALASRPSLLILDEPANHLDGQSIIALVEEIKNSFEISVLIISHHELFHSLSHRTYSLESGKLMQMV